MSTQSWERLDAVVKWSELTIHQFAMKIGMNRSDNLYRIIRNKEEIHPKLAKLVCNNFTEISYNWLMDGEGEMIDKLQVKEFSIFSKIFSILDADYAVSITDGAMEPRIPMGAVIVMTQQKVETIVCGKIYYVKTENLELVRIVCKSELFSDVLILKAIDETNYDDITIYISDILNIYLVTGFAAKLL